MTDKTLSSIVGGSGSFTAKFYSGKLTLASSSTELIIPSPPSGQRVRLSTLIADTGTQAGVTIDVGATTVVTALTLSSGGTSTDGSFLIGTSGATATNETAGYISGILGGINEVITISISAPSTPNIGYSYEFGV